VIEAEITGRETPQARPRAENEKGISWMKLLETILIF
jgi:hypothetical protein